MSDNTDQYPDEQDASRSPGHSPPDPPGYSQAAPPPGYGAPPRAQGYGQPPGGAAYPAPGPQGYGPPAGPNYGQATGQPSWHQVAPEQVARMYQPGIIPLRPLSLGDIFGGAISTIRRNPEATIGMAAAVLGIALFPSLALAVGLQFIPVIGPDGASFIGYLITIIVSYFATLALSGFIMYVVSEAALGDKVSLGQTWRAVRSRLPALIGVTLLTALILLALLTVGFVVFAIGLGIGDTITITLGVIVLIAIGLVTIWVGVRLVLAPAPVVLEKAGPIGAIKRSWALSSGRQFWRIFGIVLLAQILGALVGGAISTPVQLVIALVSARMIENESYLLLILVFGQNLSQFVVGLIVTPFTSAVTALLYVDQRIRREALDITMQQTASARAGERARS